MADDPKAWIALTTSGLALAGTLFNTFAGEWLASRRDKRDAEKIVSRFRDPLMHAAYDLQSRLYNILKQDFLGRYFVHGTPREKDYAIENTTFVLAQFLGWIEAIREGVQSSTSAKPIRPASWEPPGQHLYLARSDNNGPDFDSLRASSGRWRTDARTGTGWSPLHGLRVIFLQPPRGARPVAGPRARGHPADGLDPRPSGRASSASNMR